MFFSHWSAGIYRIVRKPVENEKFAHDVSPLLPFLWLSKAVASRSSVLSGGGGILSFGSFQQ